MSSDLVSLVINMMTAVNINHSEVDPANVASRRNKIEALTLSPENVREEPQSRY